MQPDSVYRVKIPIHSSSPPKRKLTQKDPITAEIRKAHPAQMIGLHNQREQYIRSTAFRIHPMRKAVVLCHLVRRSLSMKHVCVSTRIYS